jgi:hypothetical protein
MHLLRLSVFCNLIPVLVNDCVINENLLCGGVYLANVRARCYLQFTLILFYFLKKKLIKNGTTMF